LKIDKSKVENQQLTLTLHIDESEIEKYLNRAAQKLSNQLKIPGFRKGKAPKSIVEKIVGKEGLVEESLQFSVPDLVNNAIEQEKLEVFATPKISVLDLVPKLKLEAKVALKPNAVLGKVEDIKLEIKQDKVGAKEVNNIIEQSQNQHASWVPVQRKSKMGDLISLDFKCESDSEIIMDHKSIEIILENQYEDNLKMPGLMKKLCGLKDEDDKNFKLELPDDFFNEKFKNANAKFEVKIISVKEKNLPEVDDNFAKIMDPSVKDLKDLKKQIKKNLELNAKNKFDQDLWDGFIDSAIDKSKFTIPEIMSEQETENLIKQQKEMIENQKIEFDAYLSGINKTEEEFESELNTSAEQRLKRAIVIEEIVNHYKVEIDDKVINEELKKFKELQKNTSYSDQSISDEIKYQKKRDEILKIIKKDNIKELKG
tara:strand:+ start:2437 stop:3717 length:1281 start_codon:yes stop_codon:yes gene_type:complete